VKKDYDLKIAFAKKKKDCEEEAVTKLEVQYLEAKKIITI